MSDYSPPYTDKDAKLEQRRDRANAELRKVELSKLTVGDLFTIKETYKNGTLPAIEYYVDRIEGILKRTTGFGDGR